MCNVAQKKLENLSDGDIQDTKISIFLGNFERFGKDGTSYE